MPHLTSETWVKIGVGILIFAGSILLSFGLAAFMLVRMPPDYFLEDQPAKPSLDDRSAWKRVGLHIGKNILGVLLVVLGVVLSLPGVPGQGVLTILIGLTLIDFPGKKKLEKRILKIPAVRSGANRIRARFGKPSFLFDAEPEATPT